MFPSDDINDDDEGERQKGERIQYEYCYADSTVILGIINHLAFIISIQILSTVYDRQGSNDQLRIS
jgi:hypothetical protein